MILTETRQDMIWLCSVHGRHLGVPWNRPKKKRSMKKTQSEMVVLAEFKPEDVLPYVGRGLPPETFHVGDKSYKANINSVRLQTFQRSLKCVGCGIAGTVMRLEHGLHSDKERPHFNLYAVLPDGRDLLMTRDHIIPKSKGGSEALSNMNTMCCLCNCAKGDKLAWKK